MALEPIHRRTILEPDRAEVQERVARAVEADPERFMVLYRQFEQSLGGRYVSADLFKETFPDYRASPESRNRYNTCVHNAAAVLASEYLRQRIAAPEPERDTVILLTGIPGAGKTSSILETGELPEHIRTVYEGQLSNPETGMAKVSQVLDAGLRPVIVAVHASPERALKNTLQRFEELGRGASIGIMASIQGGLPDSLAQVRERYGDAVALTVVDRRVFHDPVQLNGWEHLPVLKLEGDREHIRHRLAEALEQYRLAGRIELDAYSQARGLAPRFQDRQLDLAADRGNETHGGKRVQAQENRQEALLTPPASSSTLTDRLRERADEVAARLLAEQAQERAENARTPRHELEPGKSQEHGHDRRHDLDLEP